MTTICKRCDRDYGGQYCPCTGVKSPEPVEFDIVRNGPPVNMSLKSSATERMLEQWRKHGPDFGRSKQGPTLAEEIGNSGPGTPVSHGDLMQMTEGVHATLNHTAIRQAPNPEEAQRQINRAAACLWRMREAALDHLRSPNYLSRDVLKAVIDERS